MHICAYMSSTALLLIGPCDPAQPAKEPCEVSKDEDLILRAFDFQPLCRGRPLGRPVLSVVCERRGCPKNLNGCKKRRLNLSIRLPLIRHTGRGSESVVQEAVMASQHTTSQTLISIVAAALVVPLVILFGNLDGPAARLMTA